MFSKASSKILKMCGSKKESNDHLETQNSFRNFTGLVFVPFSSFLTVIIVVALMFLERNTPKLVTDILK